MIVRRKLMKKFEIKVGQVYQELNDKFVITHIDTYNSNQVGYNTLGIHKFYNNGKVEFESYPLTGDNYSYISEENFIEEYDSWKSAIQSSNFLDRSFKVIEVANEDSLKMLTEYELNYVVYDQHCIDFVFLKENTVLRIKSKYTINKHCSDIAEILGRKITDVYIEHNGVDDYLILQSKDCDVIFFISINNEFEIEVERIIKNEDN